jgi:DNA-binding response OmpR family regulator
VPPAASSSVRILIVSADTAQAQKMGLALDDAGLGVTWCSFAPTEIAENLKDFSPTLLLVQAELSSPQLAALLARVEAASLPVVVLCKDTSDDVFVRFLTMGVVELLQEPFSARAHVSRLRLLLAELGDRPGELSGRTGGRELSDLVQHLMRTRRTGGLAVGEVGRAFFVRGVLKAARYRDLAMQPALAAMIRESGPWRFSENANGDAASSFVAEIEPPAVPAGPRRAAAAPVPLDAPPPVGTGPGFGEVPGLGAPVPGVAAAPPNALPPLPGLDQALPGPDEGFTLGAPPPITSTHAALNPAAPAPAPAAPPGDADAARSPLLLVDDDGAVVAMLANYFKKKGYPVTTAADGVEAAQLVASRYFELVLADLNMPRLDGWGFLRTIRDDLRSHETLVAFFSAQDNYRESLRLLHAGAQAYFPKTMRLTALELQLKELLEPRRRFTRLINSEGGLLFPLGTLGTQWVLRALTQAGFSGQLDANDSWATWRLWFERGRLVQCTSKVGANTFSGDQALAGYVTSRHLEGSLSRGMPAPDEGFGGQPTAATLLRVVTALAEGERRAQEAQLARARSLVVDEELYRLYLSVGPPAWQPMVRMLCEEQLPPAEVMARLRVTPAELAAVVKDLLRRGVATLQA